MVLKTVILFVTIALFIVAFFLAFFKVKIAPRERFEFNPSTKLYEYNGTGKRFLYSDRYMQAWFPISQKVRVRDDSSCYCLACLVVANKESKYKQNMAVTLEDVRVSFKVMLDYMPSWDVYPELEPEETRVEYFTHRVELLSWRLTREDGCSLKDAYLTKGLMKHRLC